MRGNWWRRHWPLWWLGFFGLGLMLWPEGDLHLMELGYDAKARVFIWAHLGWVQWLYGSIRYGVWLLVSLGLGMCLLGFFWARPGWVRNGFFALTSLALGPGLLVNGLKAISGRPRPWQIDVFGGEANFVPAWRFDDACVSNCSFVSGHASVGFAIFWILAWLDAKRRDRWLVLGMLGGLWVGLGRMLQGGHFPSDVVWSGWLVYVACWFSAWWVGGTQKGK